MQRYLLAELARHYRHNRQMAFVSGPRQVGKTTLAAMLGETFAAHQYFNWDNPAHRQAMLQGTEAIASALGLHQLRAEPPLGVFDELHKYRDWRNLLKGFFDQYQQQARVLVTGSASLETFRRGGDSLMGRYFPYTLHPVSVAELTDVPAKQTAAGLLNRQPVAIDDAEWQALWQFGGFPEPLLKAEQRFYRRWRRLRTQQLLRDDLRDLTRIQELGQVETLAELVRNQVGQLTSHASLARTVRVSVDTVRRWLATLESLYFCFAVKPWHHNVARALRKEPKYYLWDWSEVVAAGARAENMVASALLKAVHWWTETGQGDFALHFVRDKQKHEVDFLVTRERQPWFLVEVKTSNRASLTPALARFQQQTGANHAFQVALDAEYITADCFQHRQPIIVPARTFLAQLV